VFTVSSLHLIHQLLLVLVDLTMRAPATIITTAAKIITAEEIEMTTSFLSFLLSMTLCSLLCDVVLWIATSLSKPLGSLVDIDPIVVSPVSIVLVVTRSDIIPAAVALILRRSDINPVTVVSMSSDVRLRINVDVVITIFSEVVCIALLFLNVLIS